MQRRVDGAGGNDVKSNVLFCVFKSQASYDAFRPPLVIIGTEAGTPAMGLSASAALMLTMLPPLFAPAFA